MGKFKVRLKIQGFELELEGSREDASLLSQNMGQQLAGFLQPAGSVLEGEVIDPRPQSIDVTPAATSSPKKPRRRRSTTTSNNDTENSTTVDFKHEPTTYGMPGQQWKVLEKALWLLYVLKECKGIPELANASLVNTFNKHFRQAGTISSSNAARDLGRARLHKPPLVGQDTSKTPPTWFLTDEGRKRAQALIADARGSSGQ